MANKIVLKKSSVPAKAPVAEDLDYGELALNYADGKLYFKNSDNNIVSFDSGGISGNAFPIGNRYLYTATSGQQIFEAVYTIGKIDVFLNGVKQVLDIDFSASSGTDITFTLGLVAGDIVDIVAYTGSDDPLPSSDIVGISDTQTLTNKTISYSSNTLTGVQAQLVSGTNIKTINNSSILGSGNLDIDALPSQSGNTNKYLKTDGSSASWSSLPTTLNILTRASSTVNVSLGNGTLSILNHAGSTVSVSVS